MICTGTRVNGLSYICALSPLSCVLDEYCQTTNNNIIGVSLSEIDSYLTDNR